MEVVGSDTRSGGAGNTNDGSAGAGSSGTRSRGAPPPIRRGEPVTPPPAINLGGIPPQSALTPFLVDGRPPRTYEGQAIKTGGWTGKVSWSEWLSGGIQKGELKGTVFYSPVMVYDAKSMEKSFRPIGGTVHEKDGQYFIKIPFNNSEVYQPVSVGGGTLIGSYQTLSATDRTALTAALLKRVTGDKPEAEAFKDPLKTEELRFLITQAPPEVDPKSADAWAAALKKARDDKALLESDGKRLDEVETILKKAPSAAGAAPDAPSAPAPAPEGATTGSSGSTGGHKEPETTGGSGP